MDELRILRAPFEKEILSPGFFCCFNLSGHLFLRDIKGIRDFDGDLQMGVRAIVSNGLRWGKALLQLGLLIGRKPRTGEAQPRTVEEPGNLPEAYGETRVVLLPVHPYLIHAYWELTPDDLEWLKRQLGEGHETAEPVLRFYDITCIELDGIHAHSYFDVEIDLRRNNWKVHLWSPEKSYIAELGFKRADGEYWAITRSNVVDTPRAWPSTRAGATYMRVGEEIGDVPILLHRDDPSSDSSGSAAGGVKEIESVKPEREVEESEPAAAPEKQFGLSEIARPIEAFEGLSKNFDRLYGLRREEGFPPKAHEPHRLDFTELGEQKFTSGFSSRSK